MSAPSRIRVLVIDDSAVVRKLVSDALKADPEIEVVGTAVDPYAARDKINALKPDVITLDLEMPRMDGMTFLKIVMAQRPMPVIIMSSLTQKGSDYAYEALRLGAFDVLAKPNGSYSFGDLGPQLIARIKASAGARIRGRKTDTSAPPPASDGAASVPAAEDGTESKTDSPIAYSPEALASASQPEAPTAPAPRKTTSGVGQSYVRGTLARARARAKAAATRQGNPRDIILLGASTGGTEALRTVLSKLPGNLPGIAIVQHIPPVFSKTFADRLNTLCAFEVREAVDGDRLRPGLALIAPGNFHMLLQWNLDHYRVRITSGPAVWHQRPAVDLLFKSAVDAGAAPHALAGIYTGMGRDGAEGLLRLREKGATTFAQDEASCVVYGMPKAAWENGAAQRQLALDHSAEFITRHFEASLAAAPQLATAPH